MKKIEDLIQDNKSYKNVIIQEKLKSKKNTVAYVTIKNKPRVIKWFVPGFKKQMINEYSILKKGSSKLNIPFPYEMDEENNVIILSYINGENICDLINDNNIIFEEKKRLIILLANWFNIFHNYYKENDKFIIHGDPTLRNFVFTDRVWGVDLEESREGKPVEDIAGMCSSILTTDPMFTKEKFDLCKIFIDEYIKLSPGRIIKINDEIAYSLLTKIQWRPNDEQILRKHSKNIKIRGLDY